MIKQFKLFLEKSTKGKEAAKEWKQENRKANRLHIKKALTSKHIEVRKAAILHPNVTKAEVAKALEDKDEAVRKAAETHVLKRHGIKESVSFSKLKQLLRS